MGEEAFAAYEVEDGVLDFVDVLILVYQDVVELGVVAAGDAGGEEAWGVGLAEDLQGEAF